MVGEGREDGFGWMVLGTRRDSSLRNVSGGRTALSLEAVIGAAEGLPASLGLAIRGRYCSASESPRPADLTPGEVSPLS
jgi:hypothetical protein